MILLMMMVSCEMPPTRGGESGDFKNVIESSPSSVRKHSIVEVESSGLGLDVCDPISTK